MLRIALDTVRSGSPDADVVRGAVSALVADERLDLTFVGPEQAVQAAISGTDRVVPASRARVADAARAVSADDDAVVAVRARSDASIRVAVDLLKRGEVDAVVSAGPLQAAVAAARFGLDRVPGMRDPALAVELRLPTGALLVADAGATAEATGAGLARIAELAAEVARRRGMTRPRLALHAPGGLVNRGLNAAAEAIATADLGEAEFRGLRSTPEVLDGSVDVVLTTGALGETLATTARTLLDDAGGHIGLLLGPSAPIARLDAADPADVATAIAELAQQVRATLPATSEPV